MALSPAVSTALLACLVHMGSAAPLALPGGPHSIDGPPEALGWPSPTANLTSLAPTAPSVLTGNRSRSEQESFNLSKDIAVQFVLGKVLRALGPRFEKDLPSAPTNATLTPLDSALTVETDFCPTRYRRCSSLTFYPSCELPRNTNRHMWNRRFSLFYDISEQLSSIHRADVLNATLRLYKNISIPLNNPMTLIVRLHAFTQSLRLNRERSILVASTRVSNDYNGWVFLNVEGVFRRLKSRHNYGFKLSVKNERNEIWNIPNLFVKMDCQASNESLVPLPFEVQLNDPTQRYPALNIRYGSQEVIQDNSDFINEMGSALPPSPDNRRIRQRNNPGSEPMINVNNLVTTPNYTNVLTTTETGEHYRGNSRNLDQLVNPHLFSQNDMADHDSTYDDTSSYHIQSHESHAYSDLPYPESIHRSYGYSHMQNEESYRKPVRANKAKRHGGDYSPNQAISHGDYTSDYQDDIVAMRQHLSFLNAHTFRDVLEHNKTSADSDYSSDYVMDRPIPRRTWRHVPSYASTEAALNTTDKQVQSRQLHERSRPQLYSSSRLLRRQLRRNRQQLTRRHRQLHRRQPASRAPAANRLLA